MTEQEYYDALAVHCANFSDRDARYFQSHGYSPQDAAKEINAEYRELKAMPKDDYQQEGNPWDYSMNA